MLFVEHSKHFVFVYDKKSSGREGRGSSHADRLASHAALAKKIRGTKHRDDSFFTCAIHNREFYTPLLNVEDGGRIVTLSEDGLAAPIFHDSFGNPGRIEESLWVEGTWLLGFGILSLHGCAESQPLRSRVECKRTVPKNVLPATV